MKNSRQLAVRRGIEQVFEPMMQELSRRPTKSCAMAGHLVQLGGCVSTKLTSAALKNRFEPAPGDEDSREGQGVDRKSVV